MVGVQVQGQSFFSNRLQGKVSSKSGDVAATHVLNTTSKKAVITDIEGYFTISAKLNDTLVFSAVQSEKKEVVITRSILAQKLWNVFLETAINQLEEVILTPYNLSGRLGSDVNTLKTEPIVTASSLNLPNAHAKRRTQTERLLIEATTGGGIPLNPIINAITGRTRMLKKRLAIDKKSAKTEEARNTYADSLFSKELKIPIPKIDDFMYFCEVDPDFELVLATEDYFKIWEYMKIKSFVYRKNNKLK